MLSITQKYFRRFLCSQGQVTSSRLVGLCTLYKKNLQVMQGEMGGQEIREKKSEIATIQV